MSDHRYWTGGTRGKQIEVPPMDELCDMLTTKFLDQEKRIAYLEEENEKLKSDVYKDEEMTEMREDMERYKTDYLRGFPISEYEQKAIDAWKKKHEDEKHSGYGKIRGGAIGESYTYHFTPTYIGTFGTIRCSCGEEFDFQEA